MKLSTRSTYGMRALIELALSASNGPLSAAHIAQRQGLSVAYLEQLLHRLKRHGFITSTRGPRGGYVLAKHPRVITVADLVTTLDEANGASDLTGGGVALDWQSANGQKRASSILGRRRSIAAGHAQSISQAVWRCVHDRLVRSLSEVSLQDLCDEVRETAGEPLDHRYVFHI